MRLPFILSVLFGYHADSASSKTAPEFRVRRRGHGNARKLATDDDFVVTYSDDSISKTMKAFYLDLFVTPSQLQADAIPILRMALNKFLLAELTAVYTPEDYGVESVGSEVLSYSSTTKTSGRSLQEVGTEAEMQVTVTFSFQPAPSHSNVEANLISIMADLQYFVTNLTSFQHVDWVDVTEAYRRELPTPAPTAAPMQNTTALQGSGNSSKTTATIAGTKNTVVGAIVPTTLVAATLIAMVAFLFVQRRAQTITETPKGDDVMFVGVENDLYSLDRSLESSRSPRGLLSPDVFSVEYSTSVDGSIQDDSVSSGIDYTPSNYTNVRHTKSLLSGFTHASASTIRASNMDKQDRERLESLAAASSLFALDDRAFDEEETPSDLEDVDMTPPNLTKSDVSDESDTRRVGSVSPVPHPQNDEDQPSPTLHGTTIEQPRTSYLACYGNKPISEPISSSHVLADLEVLANSRGPSPRDPTPTAKQQNVSSYNIFNCNPIIPKEPETTLSKEYRLDGTRNYSANSSPMRNNSMFACGTNTTTPLTKNAAAATLTPGSAAASIVSNRSANSQRSAKSNGSGRVNLDMNGAPGTVGAMSGKATRSIDGHYGSVPVGDRSRANSVDGSSTRNQLPPPHSGSKSVPSSPERAGFHLGPALRPTPMNDSAYAVNLSRPSTPGDFENSLHLTDYDNSGYGCYPFRRHVAQAPSATGEDPPPSGRRHAGNTGIDGTAMYQTNAMHPLDWSYKSADMQSVGESTISENDGPSMPRQFLFGGKKDAKSTATSPGAEPRTPASQRSGKSGTTYDSSQGSASRQLINDLVWLERKIADVRQGSMIQDPPAVDRVDSLSYVSEDNDAFASVSSHDESEGDPTVSTGRNESVMSSIVCRDCYAPPGKLHIVIHSTKDGPAVHTVKQGSSLQGHIFPGDLIISVDNVDTRSFTAEQVMKMMASKSNKERKITVLHFEEED